MNLTPINPKVLANREKVKRHTQKNKEAVYAKTKIWKEKNPEAIKKHRALWYSIPENRIKHTLAQAKRRALKNNVLFDITFEDLLPLPERCPVFNTPLNYSGTGDRKGFVDNSPSIDRLIPSLGYTKGNVKIVSWRANRIKSDASVHELSAVLNYIKRELA
jgi:hypothetical protein